MTTWVGQFKLFIIISKGLGGLKYGLVNSDTFYS